MSGDDPSGADDQQERPGIEQWIVGFVDGEGCFSCPIHRNPATRIGWQLQPRFSVVQSARSIRALECIQRYFGCGKVYRNHRHDNHREDLCTYTVFNRAELRDRIVPFFEQNPLITAKNEDFCRFRQILGLMNEGAHLTIEGMARIARITERMNRRQPSRFLESSEAIRQPALLDGRGEDMVLASWRHGERLERNSLSGKFRPARMA